MIIVTKKTPGNETSEIRVFADDEIKRLQDYLDDNNKNGNTFSFQKL